MKADLHDFHITPQGTALLTAFDPIDCNLSALGGPAGGAVTDTRHAGTRPQDRARAARVAQPRPRAHGRLLQQRQPRQRGMAVRLLPPELLPAARQRPHADLRPQHLRAVRTEHADRPGAEQHRRASTRASSSAPAPRPPTSTTRPCSPTGPSASSTTAPCPRSTRSRAAWSSPLDAARPTRSSPSSSTRARCRPAARATCSRCPTATRSSAGANGPTSPSSPPAASCCSTPTCTAPISPIAPTASPGRGRRAKRPRSRPAPPARALRSPSMRAGTATRARPPGACSPVPPPISWRPSRAPHAAASRRRSRPPRGGLRAGAGARRLRRRARQLARDQGLNTPATRLR